MELSLFYDFINEYNESHKAGHSVGIINNNACCYSRIVITLKVILCTGILHIPYYTHPYNNITLTPYGIHKDLKKKITL